MATSTIPMILPKQMDAFSVSANSTVTRTVTTSAEEIYQVLAFRAGTGIICGWLLTSGGVLGFDGNNAAISLTNSDGVATITNGVPAQIRVKVIRLA